MSQLDGLQCHVPRVLVNCPKCQRPWNMTLAIQVESHEPFQCPSCMRAWRAEQKAAQKERLVARIAAGERWGG